MALVLRAAATLDLLLIRRVERAGDPWSGHMALPGGRRSAGDADLVAAAFRETYEEVGVPLRPNDLLGALDEVSPLRLPPVVIAPFVVAVDPAVELRLDTREVAAAVWIPVDALRDSSAAAEILIELEGDARTFPALRYLDYEIWGLTHGILTQFLALLS